MVRISLPSCMALVFGAILLVVFLSALLAPSGSIGGLDGRVGVIDHDAQWDGMDPFTGSVYRVGEYFCHQIEDRSLQVNGNQMPICARDLGILVGFVAAATISSLWRGAIPWWLIAMLVLPIVIDGGMQAITDHISNNPLRLATGTLGGAGAMWGMLRMMEGWIRDIENGG